MTFNLKHFPETELRKWNLEAGHPDGFVVGLIDLDAEKVFESVQAQRSALLNPSISADDFVTAIERRPWPRTAARLRKNITQI